MHSLLHSTGGKPAAPLAHTATHTAHGTPRSPASRLRAHAVARNEASESKQRLAKLRLLEQERDAAVETARVCSKRSHRLLARVQNLKRYAREKMEANDAAAVQSTLKTKDHVLGILEKTISRAQNNYRLAAKLEEFIGYMQQGLAQDEEPSRVTAFLPTSAAAGGTLSPPATHQHASSANLGAHPQRRGLSSSTDAGHTLPDTVPGTLLASEPGQPPSLLEATQARLPPLLLPAAATSPTNPARPKAASASWVSDTVSSVDGDDEEALSLLPSEEQGAVEELASALRGVGREAPMVPGDRSHHEHSLPQEAPFSHHKAGPPLSQSTQHQQHAASSHQASQAISPASDEKDHAGGSAEHAALLEELSRDVQAVVSGKLAPERLDALLAKLRHQVGQEAQGVRADTSVNQ